MVRRFYLYRRIDQTGVSGTGVIAEGARFSDGTAVLRWLPTTSHGSWTRGVRPSTAIYENMDSIEAIHGHNGQTRIIWNDEEEAPKDGVQQRTPDRRHVRDGRVRVQVVAGVEPRSD